MNGETLTRDNFKNPPAEMGILPFWFWNGEMDEKEMEWQMKEYKDRGITGLFIHGRFGEKIGYLSDIWMERVKFAVEKAKEIGIDTWVYDEMNWPSGTAERQVPKQFPNLKQKYLELVALNVEGPLFTFLEATDSRYVNTGDSKPIAAYACSDKEYNTSIKNLIDLNANLSFNKVIPWEAPAGKWRLLYFLEKEVDYYIDALNPESTSKFIELTHEKYKKSVGSDFGTVVPGFYTDEPAMHYYHVGVDNYVVPWTNQMFKVFRQRRGYDLKPYLPALYLDMGKITSKIRYDFWRTLSEQYSDSYYKQIREWCDENGVIFTGHLLFEEWLRLQARCEGNIFNHLKHMHLIGVDHLYPKIGTEKEPDQHVAIKLASSAAHHFGSTRLLCESMGGAYWDCTLERMKWIANWEYVLGVNLFNNHGYHYSIEGERKRDWPPSQFYHHTWWKYYDIFTSYMSRLGHILSGGRHVAKVLMMFPLNSIWTNYVPQKRSPLSKLIEDNFYFLTDALLRLHYDYDYVDEDVFNEANISDGKIRIADEEYSVLVLPPTSHIKRNTFECLKKFIASGGKIIADSVLPIEFLEDENDGAVNSISELFGLDPQKLFDTFKEAGNNKLTSYNSNQNVYVLRNSGLKKHEKRAELKTILEKCLTPDITISHPEVFYLHRIKDDFDIYFLINSSQEPIGSVEISFEKIALPELWNITTGEIKELKSFKIKDGRLTIQLDFPATEAHVIVLKNELPERYVTDTNMYVEEITDNSIIGYSEVKTGIHTKVVISGTEKEIQAESKEILPPLKLGKNFAFHLEDDNVLCISKWKMTMDDGLTENEFAKPEFNDSTWLDVTLGAWEMQLPQERDVIEYPVTLFYRTKFELDAVPDNTRVLVDGFSGSDYKLFINGVEITDKGIRSKLDAEIKEVNIQPFVKKGINTVAVRLVITRRTDGILDLLKIIGNFSLKTKGSEYVAVSPKKNIKTGDWVKQGYPFYSGTGVYTTEIDIPEEYLEGKLFLKAECGEDVLEVVFNTNERFIIPWNPYKADITEYLKPGKNQISFKVTNTLINVLEGTKKKSGLFGEPEIIYYPKYQISF